RELIDLRLDARQLRLDPSRIEPPHTPPQRQRQQERMRRLRRRIQSALQRPRTPRQSSQLSLLLSSQLRNRRPLNNTNLIGASRSIGSSQLDGNEESKSTAIRSGEQC